MGGPRVVTMHGLGGPSVAAIYGLGGQVTARAAYGVTPPFTPLLGYHLLHASSASCVGELSALKISGEGPDYM